jgi:hypothetical protein
VGRPRRPHLGDGSDPEAPGAGELASRGAPKELEQIGLKARQDDLGFGITEAGVVLDHARSARREHDANEERAAVVETLVRDGIDGGADDLVLDAFEQIRRDDLGGRVGAHAAGVGTGIAVTDTLVILRGGQDDVIAAGDDDEEGGFFPHQAVLEQNL